MKDKQYLIFEQEQWVCPEIPEWGPLEKVLMGSDHIGYFMYLGTVICKNAEERIGTYKHSITRRCLHIDSVGRFYRYDGSAIPKRYVEIERDKALEHCLGNGLPGLESIHN